MHPNKFGRILWDAKRKKSLITCSETVLRVTKPPVFGGFVTINLPSLAHSTMGNPMLSLKIKEMTALRRQVSLSL